MTRSMLQDRRYLAYTLDTLADPVWLPVAQVFAKQFREINGITAQEFIKRELARVNEQGNSAPVVEDGSRSRNSAKQRAVRHYTTKNKPPKMNSTTSLQKSTAFG